MTTIIVDTDILAFQASKGSEKVVRWPNGIWSHWADEKETLFRFKQALKTIQDDLKADKTILALSSTNNFRKQVLSTYKGNRIDNQKPLTYKYIVDWCFDKQVEEDFSVVMKDGLEGDDVLGILATSGTIEGDIVLVSEDKDLKTIPCTLYNPKKKTLETFTEDEADYWWMFQTLTGDATDNYKGCPKIGPKTAEKVLDKDCTWASIFEHFEKNGLTEREALQQARVARILRASDYDFENGKVILWEP
jgi:DNA polymerase-1